MNNINFKQDGGLPLSTDILDWLQQKIDTLQVLAEIKGGTPNNNQGFIISGCNVSGDNVESGYIYATYNGGNPELFRFIGGNKAVNGFIELVETKTELLFEDNICRDVLFVRELKLTSTDTGFPFSSIKEKSTAPTNDTLKTEIDGLKDVVDDLEEEIVKLVPKGIIVMWSGSLDDIPNGWALCDGQTSGVPDLTRKFIYGAGNGLYVNGKGGHDTITLREDQLPKHRHYMARNSLSDPRTYDGNSITPLSEIATFREAHEKSNADYRLAIGNEQTDYVGVTSGSIVRDGNGNQNDRKAINRQEPINIIPPYYALAYIMKL